MDRLIALAGNPNAGKTTVFNALTGLRQHTGNWPGKTVLQTRGKYYHKNKVYTLVDLPGTYSLLASSAEEQIARDFICFGGPSVTVAVVDATCLERNLNLVLQITEATSRVVVCLNLIDEARRKNIWIDVSTLSRELGVPVVPTAARTGEGLEELKDTIAEVAEGTLNPVPWKIVYNEYIEAAVQQLEEQIKPVLNGRFNSRWIALRLLEGDEKITSIMAEHAGLGLNQKAGSLKLKGVPV